MIPDAELLRQYAEHGDEAAYAEVVNRYVDLVYSAALRLVGGDAHLAQDVAQGVFTTLARQAARLARHASIVGWLYTTTRYTAGNLRREQHRRSAHEQEAYAMNQPAPTSEVNWDALQPVLDEAVCTLAATDREAVLLRFFQNKSHREVGDALGLGEEAARKRVDRALEKLRAHFARRGVAVSAGVLAAEIGANSVQAAPVGLAASLAGTSLAKAGGMSAGSAFLAILLMSTKTKILLTVAVIALIMALFVFKWQPSKPSAVAEVAAPTTSPTVVALPQSPVVAESSAADPISPNTSDVVKSGPASVSQPGATKASSHIRFAREPANGPAAVMAAIVAYKADPQNYVNKNGKTITRPYLDDLSLLKVVPQLSLYDISAVDIASGRGLEAAQPKGFYYTVYAPGDSNGQYVFSADQATIQLPIFGVVVQDDPGTASGAAVDSGVLMHREAADALEKLENLEQVQNGTYEMRRLQVRMSGGNGAGGAIERNLVMVFWLKSDSGGPDLIYPFQAVPLPAGLNQYQLYTVDDFLKILRPIAQQKIAKQPQVANP